MREFGVDPSPRAIRFILDLNENTKNLKDDDKEQIIFLKAQVQKISDKIEKEAKEVKEVSIEAAASSKEEEKGEKVEKKVKGLKGEVEVDPMGAKTVGLLRRWKSQDSHKTPEISVKQVDSSKKPVKKGGKGAKKPATSKAKSPKRSKADLFE